MSLPAAILRLRNRSADKQQLADRAVRNPELIAALLEGLRSGEAPIRFGSAKVLILLSQQHPDTVYPHIDKVFKLLESENNVLRWGAIQIVGNLSAVDQLNKINRRIASLLRPINGPDLPAAANTLHSAAQIAVSKPGLANRVGKAIMDVEQAQFDKPNCRNIAIGKAIEALDLCYDQLGDKPGVHKFVQRQQRNPHAATRKKAERFFGRHALPATRNSKRPGTAAKSRNRKARKSSAKT